MYAVQMQNITKRFNNTVANDSVSFHVQRGEIHSLLGENGAGKTTLMKLLYGMYQPDEGNIFINEKKVKMANPNDAIAMGIAMVHQHFMLVDTLSVAENVVIGYEPRKGPFFHFAKALHEVEQLSQKYGLRVNPKEKIDNLSVGTMQRVEILKALYRKADILILDEPTAVLTPIEVEELFHVLKELKADGKTIIMITHKLKETLAIADRATILQNGRVIKTLMTKDATEDQLAELMVGRKVSFKAKQVEKGITGEKIIDIQHVSLQIGKVNVLNEINLSIFGGEIVGLAGVEGNGQTQLIEVLTGLSKPTNGDIIYKNQQITSYSPIQRIKIGIGHIPEDRNRSGLVGEFSVKENAILGYHKTSAFQNRKIFKKNKIREYAELIREHYNVKAASIEMPVKALSGGNQQKIIIGRVLSQNPDFIIAAQPTRGVDIGAIEYIHERLIEMRNKGKAILLISAELDEIRKLSDKIAVLYEGKIVAFDRADSFSEHDLGVLMTGGTVNKNRQEEAGYEKKPTEFTC